MKKILLFVFVGLISVGLSSAQQRKYSTKPTTNAAETIITQRSCGTGTLPDEYEIWFQQKIEEFKIKQAANKTAGITTVYNIPVVVHVIYNSNPQNISTAQINSQIAVLNEDYRRLNPDTTNTPAPFKPAAADCEINFCLAQTDPFGNATTGIDRITVSSAGFTAPPYQQSYIDATIKPATIWNPNEYLNLWVLPDFYQNTLQLLGYATFPAGSTLTGLTGNFGTATTDGVVIWYKSFGRTGVLDPSYNKGRTATHEIGHWLGLRHIWGDANCGNDYCSDTPTQQTANGTCPTYPHVTCSNGPNGDMFMNYMDYPPDVCLNEFTQNQKTRMQTAMANSPMRVAVASSNKCSAPIPAAPVAQFSASATTVTLGGSLNFTDLSSNSPTSWAWTFTGGTPSSSTIQNPSGIVYNTAGTYTVTLVATNVTGTDTETKTGYITVTAGGGGCDSITNFDVALYTPTIYLSNVWGYVSGQNNWGDVAKADMYSVTQPNKSVDGVLIFFGIGSSSGTGQTADVNVWDDNGTGGLPSTVLGTKSLSYDTIANAVTNVMPVYVDFTPNIPVSGNIYVGVEYGYHAGDTLAVISSADGQMAIGAGTAYEKWGSGDWYAFTDSLSWNLDIAHLIIPIVCTITGIDENNELRRLAVFPNPTRDLLNVVIPEQKSNGNVTMKVLNVTGAQVLETVSKTTLGGQYVINVADLSAGFYFLEISTSEGRRLEKFQIIR